MNVPRKPLTVGHSYAVRLNRKLADAAARGRAAYAATFDLARTRRVLDRA